MATYTIMERCSAYDISLDVSPDAHIRKLWGIIRFLTNAIIINGVTYNISNYSNGKYFELTLDLQSDRGYYFNATLYLITPDSRGSIISFGYNSPINTIVGRVYNTDAVYSNTQVSSTATHVTPLNINIQTNNCNVNSVNPSSLNFEWGTPTTGNAVIGYINASFIANEGYTFIGTNSTAQCGNLNFDDRFVINDNQLEFTLHDTSNLDMYLLTDNLDLVINAYSTNPPSVTNNLTNVTNDNPASSVTYGASYVAHIVADTGYYIDSIVITMGGIDITTEVLSNGTINIPSVIGDIIITATGRLNPTVSYNLTGCTLSNTPTEVEYKSPYVSTVTPASGYSLEDMSVIIIMGGVEQYNVYENGVINIPEVTGDLVIILTATLIKTFTFKSMDGNTTYVTINAVKISTLLFTIEGNTRRLVVNGITYTWLEIIPDDKQLIGLALTPNSERYVIPLNVEVVVNYNQTMSFYEVIIDEQQPVETFSLILYKNNTQNERVDKTNYLQYKGTLDGVLRDRTSVLSPQIRIEWNGVIDFNYVYIPIFNRYYFVTDVIYFNKSLATVNLRVDVLMSHKNAIYQQNALIGRNEYQYNEYLIDEQRIVRDDALVEFVRQEGSDFFNPDRATSNIIVDVIGGQE